MHKPSIHILILTGEQALIAELLFWGQLRIHLFNERQKDKIQLQHAATATPENTIYVHDFFTITKTGGSIPSQAASQQYDPRLSACTPSPFCNCAHGSMMVQINGALIMSQTLSREPEKSTTYVIPLHSWGILGVEGPEASKFLQGQLTCDLRDLNAKVTRIGAHCTQKGRMLFSFRALQVDEETIYLSIPEALVEKAQLALGKYIVFSKAKLTDRSSLYQRLGLYGPLASTQLLKMFGPLPDNNGDWCHAQGNLIIKLDDMRYECWILPQQVEDLWSQLTRECSVGTDELWKLLNIRAGLGEVLGETSESFTPQSLNYQLVNGVSFRKGCYTGQEIVARLHYRGTLKRHMYRFCFPLTYEEELPIGGTAVNNEAGQPVGELVMAARASATTAEALAVVADEQRDHAILQTKSRKKLVPLTLPYAIPSEEKI